MSSVDIVVPCFRYGRFLRECVQSVLTQSGPELRVLIIDDASPDNTAEVAQELVRSDPRVDCRRHASNQGLIATANEGIAWVSADYTLLMSADDYLLPGALSRSADLMDDHPSVAFTFGDAVVPDQRGERSRRRTGVGSRTHVLSGLDFIALNGARNVCANRSGSRQPEEKIGRVFSRLTLRLRYGNVVTARRTRRRWGHCRGPSRVSIAKMSSESSREQDLLQRKAAIEHFLNGTATRLTNADEFRAWLNHMLALEAIGCASSAFNEGAMESSTRLSKLAVSTDPSVQRTRRWWFLACKRVLGLRGWLLARPAVERFRSIFRTSTVKRLGYYPLLVQAV
ncbi:glycosyltransferase family 2 protein [Bradyrhizobium ottawaense]|uniref:glycosyltransferase family 2 protein n=1 Tax=Bradyrhizobium ottawaense TaxID=931866 RepID=UPI001FD8C0BF|nr:glycosyltransferase family 2 protein [Bradyrhizobium ottawaense]